MTDLWLHTSDMLKSIANQVTIKTNDHLHYLIFANDKKNTEIGSIIKAYKINNSHVKSVIIKLHNNFYTQIDANMSEAVILSALFKVVNIILEENTLIMIENM